MLSDQDYLGLPVRLTPEAHAKVCHDWARRHCMNRKQVTKALAGLYVLGADGVLELAAHVRSRTQAECGCEG